MGAVQEVFLRRATSIIGTNNFMSSPGSQVSIRNFLPLRQ